MYTANSGSIKKP